jgi:hypothetical protein
MRTFFMKTAVVMAAAALVLTACGDAGNGGDGSAKTLVITGLPADWTEVSVVLLDESDTEYPAGGHAAVSGGAATITLKNFDVEAMTLGGNWTGTGSWLVYLWDVNVFESDVEPAAITYNLVPFSAAQTSVSYADFEDLRGAQVGQISGTVTLTDVPAGAKVSIRARVYRSGGGDDFDTSSYPVNLSTGEWTILLYEKNFRNGPADSVTGWKDVDFTLSIDLANGNYYRLEDLTKTLELTDKTDIPAGNIGARSLKAVTLSGTITVTYNGQPVPQVDINAYGGGHSGYKSLASPTANASWSITMPAFESPTDVVINVYGSDSNWDQLFSRSNAKTVSGVSTTNQSNIVINLGNITGGGGDDDPGDGPSGGGDTLAGAKGKLTLTGFSEFNGKYVYSALITISGEGLIGTNAVTFNGAEAIISMVPISGGTAEVPLYTMNTAGTTGADMYVPYEGSEGFQIVGVMILDDADGKFTASDVASFATSYAAMLSSNPSNTSFTPSTSGGSITISRSDAKTMAEMMADTSLLTTAKYMLTTP